MDNAISAFEVLTKLQGCAKGTELLVSYHAYLPVTEEAKSKVPEGMPKRMLQGRLEACNINAKGEPYLTLFVHNRGEKGEFRRLNLVRGTVTTLEILS